MEALTEHHLCKWQYNFLAKHRFVRRCEGFRVNADSGDVVVKACEQIESEDASLRELKLREVIV